MLKKLLAVTIICLLIGLSIASSTGNTVEDTYDFDVNKILFLSKNSNKKFYAVDNDNNNCIWFYPEDPGTFYDITTGGWPSSQFPQGGTFVEDEWWVCDVTGSIWIVDEETGDSTYVGISGTGELVGLAFHEKTDVLYGICTQNLYTIDMENGTANLVGAMGNPDLMISLDCDNDGNMYAYELNQTNGKFYSIDLDTGEANFIGYTGIAMSYGQDMAYDHDDDIMYACVFNYDTFQGEFHKINLTTGEFSYIGTLYNGHQTTCFAIPYNLSNQPPITTISFDPPYPDGDNGWYVSNVTATLTAWDDEEVRNIYYRIAGGEWMNHSGDVISFILDYDCLEDGLIEFYSVDFFDNHEEVKSVSIDMDQLPPDIGDPIWGAFKEGCKWYVTFLANATDACSGIDRLEMFINDGEHEIIVGAGPTYEFVIEWTKAFKSVTFWFYCYDEAGNVASVLVNGSDINSYSHSQSYRTLFLRWLERFPILQKILDVLRLNSR